MGERRTDGGPAFANMTLNSCGPVEPRREGMSLRDYFAGQALTGIVSRRPSDPDRMALEAYELADAMLDERFLSFASAK